MSAAIAKFTPSADNSRLLRDAFGRFATGVTVVTATSDEGLVGITVNSFSSLSLDPAMVLWSPAKNSNRFKFFAEPKHYAIHVLSVDQKDVCEGFAKSAWSFDGLDYKLNAHGVPLIEGCLARFECAHVATHDAGDHAIVVGQVEHAEMRDGEPLAFFSGRYGRIDAA
jgi:flavin reductase (DIM6/NTAB) family NADH-FMN oxidoreductase RutF